jgi:hypothetical protein
VAAVCQPFMSVKYVEEDVLPDGKTSFSLTMTCLRSGAARKTLHIQRISPRDVCSTNPKKATASQHIT